jgi:Putative  PD-(D/E)XK family member, (DUF4420)
MITENGDTKSSSLENIFQEMEQTQIATTNSFLQRRVPIESKCDLYIAVQKPSNQRMVIIQFSRGALPEVYTLPVFRVLEQDITTQTVSGVEHVQIKLRVVQEGFREVFTHLSEDLVKIVGSQLDETQAALALQRRLAQWQRFLQRENQGGLTSEEQRGLYGELRFLEEFMLAEMSASQAVMAWLGPMGADKDFQLENGSAIEVKTTLARAPQMLMINNERQLDNTGVNGLYLVHWLVEVQRGTGEQLTERIASIRQRIATDPIASGILEDRLLSVGYLDVHESLYNRAGYTWRGTRFYEVREGFPCITPISLPDGVGKVEYSISENACEPFAQTEKIIRQQLK